MEVIVNRGESPIITMKEGDQVFITSSNGGEGVWVSCAKGELSVSGTTIKREKRK